MTDYFLIPFLIGTIIIVPILLYGDRRLIAIVQNNVPQTICRLWLRFLILVLIARFVVGILLTINDFNLTAGLFYPIRIAAPNFGLLSGLPYVAICLAILAWLPRICSIIQSSRYKFLLLWAFGVIFLLSFGALQGGFVEGNTGVSNSEDHIYDASINETIKETFSTHIDRIEGNAKPPYRAPHSTSHPAGSIAYWQVMVSHFNAITFSLINVLFFSLSLPVMYAALRRSFGNDVALQSVLLIVTIPGFLVYGRSDDVIYYALAGMAIALISVAIREKRYLFSLGAGAFLFVGMNFSYASVVLLPAMFSFNANVPLKKIWEYICRTLPHLLLILILVAALLFYQFAETGFNFLEGFLATAQFNRPTTIWAILERGLHLRAFNDRIMTICDFLLFGGPLLLYLLVNLFRTRAGDFGAWQIKNVALTVLLVLLAINSNGSGEIARPWGSLYLLIMFCWLPDILKEQSSQVRWWLIRAQLGWALILKIPLNLIW